MKPIISAIVSTYNAADYIEGCIEDLEMQTISDQIEILVVDSASKQNEQEKIMALKKKYDNILYCRTDVRENSHLSMNRAIKKASGKYVTMANTDDRHRKDFCEIMTNELEKNEDVELVYAWSKILNDDKLLRVPTSYVYNESYTEGLLLWPDFNPRHLIQVCTIGPQAVWRRRTPARAVCLTRAFARSHRYQSGH